MVGGFALCPSDPDSIPGWWLADWDWDDNALKEFLNESSCRKWKKGQVGIIPQEYHWKPRSYYHLLMLRFLCFSLFYNVTQYPKNKCIVSQYLVSLEPWKDCGGGAPRGSSAAPTAHDSAPRSAAVGAVFTTQHSAPAPAAVVSIWSLCTAHSTAQPEVEPSISQLAQQRKLCSSALLWLAEKKNQ